MRKYSFLVVITCSFLTGSLFFNQYTFAQDDTDFDLDDNTNATY